MLQVLPSEYLFLIIASPGIPPGEMSQSLLSGEVTLKNQIITGSSSSLIFLELSTWLEIDVQIRRIMQV